jgi:uncharacterized protein YjdB
MMKGKRKIAKLVVIGVSIFLFPTLLFFGCSREVSWIHAEPKSVELREVGESFQVKFAALDKENKPVAEAKLIFESSNPKVATISDAGLITAVGTGNSIISVNSETGEKAVIQCKVAIRSTIKIEPAEVSIKVGETIQLESTVLDEKEDQFEDQVVSWASSDDAIATVNDFGEVAGIALGETTIIGTQINVYQKVKVKVEEPAS